MKAKQSNKFSDIKSPLNPAPQGVDCVLFVAVPNRKGVALNVTDGRLVPNVKIASRLWEKITPTVESGRFSD